MKTRSFTAAAALATATLALSPAAFAQQTDDRSAEVSYTDLDLSSEEGIEELDRRIDRAAKRACGFNDTTLGTRARTREARDCYRQAKRQLDRQFAQVVDEARRGG